MPTKEPTPPPQRPLPPVPPIKPDRTILHIHRIEIIDNEGRVVDMKWLYDLPKQMAPQQNSGFQAAILTIGILLLFAVVFFGR